MKRRLLSNIKDWIMKQTKEIRKPLLELTSKGQRILLQPLISLINYFAQKKKIESKTIAVFSLQLVSASSGDYSASSICCKETAGLKRYRSFLPR